MGRRRLSLTLALGIALGLAAPRPAEAWVSSLVRAISQAGRAARHAGTAGKAAKGAAVAGKIAATGATAHHAVRVFALIPDDAARVAAYVARDGDSLQAITRASAAADDPVAALSHDWVSMVDELRAAAPEAQAVDLYLHPAILSAPPPASLQATGTRLYALDAGGKPHPMRLSEAGEWVVDIGDVSLDVVSFAAEQQPGTDEEAEEEGEGDLTFFLVGLCVLGGIGVVGWRAHQQRRSDLGV